jgi:hypothetical protein
VRMAPITEEGSNHPYILIMRMGVSKMWNNENCVDPENKGGSVDDEKKNGGLFCSKVL